MGGVGRHSGCSAASSRRMRGAHIYSDASVSDGFRRLRIGVVKVKSAVGLSRTRRSI